MGLIKSTKNNVIVEDKIYSLKVLLFYEAHTALSKETNCRALRHSFVGPGTIQFWSNDDRKLAFVRPLEAVAEFPFSKTRRPMKGSIKTILKSRKYTKKSPVAESTPK